MARRLLASALFAMLATAGCNAGSISMSAPGDAGVIDVGDATATSSQAVFEARVQPLLTSTCAACHAGGTGAPMFLAADPDLYTTVTTWPALVNRRDPGSSRLLSKGEHAGPAWTATQAAILRAWIDLEVAEHADTGPDIFATDPVIPARGFNVIPLDTLGMPGT